jgi:hypothetical protein
MAGRHPGALVRPAHGLHELRDRRRRRAGKLERATGSAKPDWRAALMAKPALHRWAIYLIRKRGALRRGLT